MIRVMTAIAGLILLVPPGASVAAGQSKTLPGEMTTVTAKVEAIELSSRTLTLRKDDGTYTSVVVPDSVEKFSEIKVGDTVVARYYDTVTIRKKQSSEAALDTAAEALTPGSGAKPVGTAATQRTITATITEIDMKVPSITFKGPNNWTYSSRVADKKALETVKVGDKVDITWTEALTISVVAPKQ